MRHSGRCLGQTAAFDDPRAQADRDDALIVALTTPRGPAGERRDRPCRVSVPFERSTTPATAPSHNRTTRRDVPEIVEQVVDAVLRRLSRITQSYTTADSGPRGGIVITMRGTPQQRAQRRPALERRSEKGQPDGPTVCQGVLARKETLTLPPRHKSGNTSDNGFAIEAAGGRL